MIKEQFAVDLDDRRLYVQGILTEYWGLTIKIFTPAHGGISKQVVTHSVGKMVEDDILTVKEFSPYGSATLFTDQLAALVVIQDFYKVLAGAFQDKELKNAVKDMLEYAEDRKPSIYSFAELENSI